MLYALLKSFKNPYPYCKLRKKELGTRKPKAFFKGDLFFHPSVSVPFGPPVTSRRSQSCRTLLELPSNALNPRPNTPEPGFELTPATDQV